MHPSEYPAHIHMYIYIHTYMYPYTQLYVHIHTYIHVCTYIHIHIYRYVSIHNINIHIHTYIHIHTHIYVSLRIPRAGKALQGTRVVLWKGGGGLLQIGLSIHWVVYCRIWPSTHTLAQVRDVTVTRDMTRFCDVTCMCDMTRVCDMTCVWPPVTFETKHTFWPICVIRSIHLSHMTLFLWVTWPTRPWVI